MLLGVFISILFGVNEGIFKDKIMKDLNKNQKIMSVVDIEKRNSIIEKEQSKA